MTNDEFHKVPLNYGKTDGENLPFMPKDKYFAVGYNDKYGLVDVKEGNGVSFFEGRINIENLLAKLQSTSVLGEVSDKSFPFVKQKIINSQVEDFIMEAYNNLWDYQTNPEKHVSPPTPILEILSYNGLKL